MMPATSTAQTPVTQPSGASMTAAMAAPIAVPATPATSQGPDPVLPEGIHPSQTPADLARALAEWHASPEANISPWPQDKVNLANMVMGFQAQRVDLLADTLLQRSHDFGDSAQVSPCSPGLQAGAEAQEHMETTSEVPSVPSAPTSPAGINVDEPDKEPNSKRGRPNAQA